MRTKKQSNPYEDDDALLVAPMSYDPPKPQQQLLFSESEGLWTVDDLLTCLWDMLIALKKAYRSDLAWQFVSRALHMESAFRKERGFSVEHAPSGEHSYPLYSREKFPPKTHQRILQGIGEMWGVVVCPKKGPTGSMRLSYMGTNLHCRLLDILGRGLLPQFDADLRALYRGCIKEERPQCKDSLVAKYVDRVRSLYSNNE